VEGTWYTLRRLMWPIPRLATLNGIPPTVKHYLGYLGRSRNGLLLIAGATGEGKTTTACSLLQEYLIKYGNVAVTVEDPPELPLSGPHGRGGHCFQTQVRNKDFAAAMEATMRRSPRYILLGEVRGAREASEAIRAAANGHLVITTIHAGDVTQAINALLKFIAVSESIDLARLILAEGLLGVMHQKMVKLPGKKNRLLRIQSLFPGGDTGIRSLIRNGRTEQLGTAIAAQASKILQGKLPVEG